MWKGIKRTLIWAKECGWADAYHQIEIAKDPWCEKLTTKKTETNKQEANHKWKNV